MSRETYIAAQAGQFASKAPQFRPDYWTEPTATEIRRYYRLHIADEFTQKNQARLFAIFLPFKDFAVSKRRPGVREGPRRARSRRTIREELANGRRLRDSRPALRPRAQGGRGRRSRMGRRRVVVPEDLVDFALKGPIKELSEPMPYPSAESPRGVVVAWVAERVEQRVMPFEEAQTKIRDRIRAEHVEAARKKIIQKLVEDAYISPPDVKRDLIRLYTQS